MLKLFAGRNDPFALPLSMGLYRALLTSGLFFETHSMFLYARSKLLQFVFRQNIKEIVVKSESRKFFSSVYPYMQYIRCTQKY